jgi:hypothetical protein
MAYLIGVVLAVCVGIFGTVVGLDRERAFYCTVAIVVASYYALFAAMAGATTALAIESIFIAGFVLLAVLGFKLNLWFAVVALAGHGIFDFAHGFFIRNPGVPAWWPMFCGAYDVVAGGYLAVLLARSVITTKARVSE